MQERGFEPLKALSHEILSLARLTTSLLLRIFINYFMYFKPWFLYSLSLLAYSKKYFLAIVVADSLASFL